MSYGYVRTQTFPSSDPSETHSEPEVLDLLIENLIGLKMQATEMYSIIMAVTESMEANLKVYLNPLLATVQ